MIAVALAACFAVMLDSGFCASSCGVAQAWGMRLRFGTLPAAAAVGAAAVLQIYCMLRAPSAGAAAMQTPSLGAAAISAVTDLQTGYVFDAVTMPALCITLVAAGMSGHFNAAVLGGCASGAVLYALHIVTRGRGLGLGDVKLACCIGSALGVAGGLRALQTAFVLGGAYAGYSLLSRRAKFGDAVRFAPFLFAGMLITTMERAW